MRHTYDTSTSVGIYRLNRNRENIQIKKDEKELLSALSGTFQGNQISAPQIFVFLLGGTLRQLLMHTCEFSMLANVSY